MVRLIVDQVNSSITESLEVCTEYKSNKSMYEMSAQVSNILSECEKIKK